MSNEPIILYDLPSKGHRACWSLNPWKTRLALNYKGLDYKTEWLEYPDVAPTLKSLWGDSNVPPNESGTPYTIPTVRLPPNTHVMDSRKIASALESAYPTPPLHLDAPVLTKVEEILPQVFMPLGPVLLPRAPREVLPERSAEYFTRTRAERFGMPLDRLEKEKGGEEAWRKAEEGLRGLAVIVKAEGGPFCLGDTVSYADFVIVGFLHFCKWMGDDVFERVLATDEAFGKLYEASKKWLERDDH